MGHWTTARRRRATAMCAALGVALGAAPAAHAGDGRAVSIRGEVSAYYKQGLARTPDSAGWAEWAKTTSVNCNTNLGTRTGKGIFGSSEFLTVRKTWEARVDAAYRGLLDRNPDATGRQHYLSALYSGTKTWSQVLDAFVGSTEYVNRRSNICNTPEWSVRYTHNLSHRPSAWNSDAPWGPCYDTYSGSTRTGSVCRGLRGVENFRDPSTGVTYNFLPATYTPAASTVARVQYHGVYGANVATDSGSLYEGCQRRDSSYWRCDYYVKRPDVVSYSSSRNYWLKVLKDWSYYQATTTLACVASIVGNWVGTSDPHDIVIDCGGQPY